MSIPCSPNSFTITAYFFPWFSVRIRFKRVVLPAPRKPVKTKHLQSGSQLFYDVFKEHEPDNLLYQQAINETFDHGIESPRIQRSFEKIENLKIVWKDCKYPTPFSFPLITDRIRSKLSSESVEDRIRKMYLQLEKSIK